MNVVHHSYDRCHGCGGKKRRVALKCRTCRYKVGTHRVCTDCKRRLPVTAFRIRTRATPKPRSHCRECEVKRQRAYEQGLPPRRRRAIFAAKRRWERAHPEKHRAQILRRRVRMLGLEHEMSRVLTAVARRRRCAICGRTSKEAGGRGGLHIDHDHKRRRFRGMICSPCNTGLGQFADDPKRLRAALVYLLKHRRALDK